MQEGKKPLLIWLASGASLVALMVIVGGITRLTHSGLSMVDWKLFMGAIPPLTEADWIETFEKYKLSPEFKIKHSHFTLQDFKSIFFWEYLHRMIGRFIGVVFIVPFIYFLAKGYIKGKLQTKLYVLFFLGAFQGFLGWFMVKSGLVDRPDVSHYRLAAHLISAFTLFSYIIWLIFEIRFSDKIDVERRGDYLFRRYGFILLSITVIQIVFGAFVAGLKAGLIYNTYPMMGESWIADSVFFAYSQEGLISLFDNLASVQFIHRIFGHIVFLWVVWIFVIMHQFEMAHLQKQSIRILLLIVIVQFMLGVFTLLYAVPVWLGVVHQLGALALLGAEVYYLFQFKKQA